MTEPSRRALLKGALGSALAIQTGKARAENFAPLRIRRGVNVWPWFSLTTEYPPPRKDYDWPPFQPERPTPTKKDLDRLQRSGFDFIRLPVDPGPFLAASAVQRETLLGDLENAIGQARAAGLSVIVNLHANIATHYWTPGRMTGSVDASEFPAYRELVGAIVTRLSGRGTSDLAFEPINEPEGACESLTAAKVRLALLQEARAAAPGLTLIANGGCGASIQGLEALDPTPLESLQPLLYSFHYYEPYLFSHQGAPWMSSEPVYRSLNAVPWPAATGSLDATLAAVRSRMRADKTTPQRRKDATYKETQRLLKEYFDAQPDRAYIERHLANVDRWAKRHDIPNDRILLGEFGALRSDHRYVAAAAADRARYVEDVRRSAEAFGFPWAFWNLFDGMGLMDDRTRAFDSDIISSLGLKVPVE